MSKYLKSLITVCLVVCMTVCLGIFAAACTGGDDFTYPSSIDVTVLLDDGTAAEGVAVQICTVNDDGTADSAKCKLPKATNAQGVATIDVKETDGYNFEVHILSIPDIYQYYKYVDANGNPYAEGTGARIDVKKSNSLTVKLAVVPVKDEISEGSNLVKLDAITDTLTVKTNIKSAGWYSIASYSNAYSLSGTGFALTSKNTQVNIYLKPNDELTFSFDDENELSFDLGLTKIEADGTAAKPLPAVIGSQYVIPLEANKTVSLTNATLSYRKVAAALEVSGTNFKANYESTDYTDTFTLKAPTETVPQTFTVGTADGKAGVVTLYFGEHTDIGGEIPDLPTITLDKSFTVTGASMWEPVTYALVVTADGNYKFDTEIDLNADVVINTTLEDGAAGMEGAIVSNNGAYPLTAGTYYVSFYNDGAVTVSKK